jgi:hypothetical protein
MSRTWTKLSLGILDDPQIALLPDDLWRALVELFLLAGWQDDNGRLPDLPYMAWRMRRPEASLPDLLQRLEKTRLLCRDEQGGWIVVDFGMGVSAGPVS